MRAVREITGLCSLIGMDIPDVEKAFSGIDISHHPSESGSQGDLMSARPPTLREKRRYLLVAIEPAGTVIDQKDLYYAISDATTSLWGDAMAAVITPAVVASEGQYRDHPVPAGNGAGTGNRPLHDYNLQGYPHCPANGCCFREQLKACARGYEQEKDPIQIRLTLRANVSLIKKRSRSSSVTVRRLM